MHNVWAKFNDQPVGHDFFVPFSPVGQQYPPETQFSIHSAVLIQIWATIASAPPGATTNAHKIKILPIFIFPPFLTTVLGGVFYFLFSPDFRDFLLPQDAEIKRWFIFGTLWQTFIIKLYRFEKSVSRTKKQIN